MGVTRGWQFLMHPGPTSMPHLAAKILPWLGIAMIAVCIDADAQPAAAGSVFPEMQAGKWKLRWTRNGAPRDSEMCGDPIGDVRREVQGYAANTKWGCTMTASASGPRSVRVVHDCPSDGSPIGTVTRGRSEISIVSTSPQAFRIEMKSTVYPGYVMEGTRIGDCEQR